MWGLIIFHQVQAKSELYKFYVRYWVVQGGESSFTKCRLNLNFKILGEILGSPGGSIIFHNVQTKSQL